VANAVTALVDPEKPIASLLFSGPSGVGKTELARSLSYALFGDYENFIRIDMSEYGERHEVSRLIGAPPSYVGYGDSNQLLDKLKKKPNSLILLDEIEKAHPSIYDLLLQILDYGILTNGRGETISFRQAMIIMTSNIDLKKGKPIGFGVEKGEQQKQADFGQALQNNCFRKEFVGRLNGMIEFNHLTKSDFLKIIELEIVKISEAGKRRGLNEIIFESSAKEFIVEKSDTAEYGARNLNNSLRKLVRVPLGRMLVLNKCLSRVRISLGNEGLLFT
jgi:ATP-dependent Clp protease ATP-binding subunit ClpC